MAYLQNPSFMWGASMDIIVLWYDMVINVIGNQCIMSYKYNLLFLVMYSIVFLCNVLPTIQLKKI